MADGVSPEGPGEPEAPPEESPPPPWPPPPGSAGDAPTGPYPPTGSTAPYPPGGYPGPGFPPSGPPPGSPPPAYPPPGQPPAYPAGFPQPGSPPSGYPQPGYPPYGYPQPGYPPYGYPQPGYPPYGGYPPGATTEPLSVWSLVLGVLSFLTCPLVAAVGAIVTGSRAKRAIDRSGLTRKGRGMAVAGQVLGWSNVVLVVVVAVLLGSVAAFVGSHPSYTSLNAGDCFNPVGGGSSFSGRVSKVSCDRPHLDESVGSFELTNPLYPGEAELRSEAALQCTPLATRYVDPSQVQSLDLVFLYPSQSSFKNGTRKVVCAVRNTDGSKRTGSVAASRTAPSA